MRYLLFSIFLWCSCVSDYKTLKRITIDKDCLQSIKPKPLLTSWYDASVDVVGKHISGLLLIKNMPDSSTRVVFTNEAGVKFLDFGFAMDHSFKVHYLMKQLDRKSVIQTLRKDFELILQKPFQSPPAEAYQNEKGQTLFAYPQKNETAYFITDKDCASLQGFEVGSGRKRKSSVIFYGKDMQGPDSINLQHQTFNMNITLRKLARE